MPNYSKTLALTVGLCVCGLATTAYAALHCVDFDSTAVGTTHVVGDTISTASADFEFMPFEDATGTFNFGGVATVSASNFANGSLNNEENLNNINLQVSPNPGATSGSYKYANLGGSVNLAVNGDFRKGADMSDLGPLTIGGCDVTVTRFAIPGGHRGKVTIDNCASPGLEDFEFGGQEFYVDNICYDN